MNITDFGILYSVKPDLQNLIISDELIFGFLLTTNAFIDSPLFLSGIPIIPASTISL
jgi:hypothetical protein